MRSFSKRAAGLPLLSLLTRPSGSYVLSLTLNAWFRYCPRPAELIALRDFAMKRLPLLLGLSLLAIGCAQPYSGRGYATPAMHRSNAGKAVEAQPRDVQSALQKYIGAN